MPRQSDGRNRAGGEGETGRRAIHWTWWRRGTTRESMAIVAMVLRGIWRVHAQSSTVWSREGRSRRHAGFVCPFARRCGCFGAQNKQILAPQFLDYDLIPAWWCDDTLVRHCTALTNPLNPSFQYFSFMTNRLLPNIRCGVCRNAILLVRPITMQLAVSQTRLPTDCRNHAVAYWLQYLIEYTFGCSHDMRSNALGRACFRAEPKLQVVSYELII